MRKAFIENLNLANQGKQGVGRPHKVKVIEYSCKVDYPSYWRFYKNPDRLYELMKKQDKHQFMRKNMREQSVEEIFTENDLKEMEKIEADSLDFVSAKDVKAFMKGCGELGKGSLVDIRREYLPDWSEENLKKFVKVVWPNFDRIPNSLKELNKIEKNEYEAWKKIIFAKLGSVFQRFESDEDFFLPLDMLRFVMMNDSKTTPPEYCSFILHYFSTLNPESNSQRLKTLLFRHEVLQSEPHILVMTYAEHEKKFDKYINRMLGFLDVKIPAHKQLTDVADLEQSSWKKPGIFARTEDGILDTNWINKTVDELKLMMEFDFEADLDLGGILRVHENRGLEEEKSKLQRLSENGDNSRSMVRNPSDDIEEVTNRERGESEEVEPREGTVNDLRKNNPKVVKKGSKNTEKKKATADKENGGDKRKSLFDFGISVANGDQKKAGPAKMDEETSVNQNSTSSNRLKIDLKVKDHPDEVDLDNFGKTPINKSSSNSNTTGGRNMKKAKPQEDQINTK